jgi:hypothetical protein
MRFHYEDHLHKASSRGGFFRSNAGTTFEAMALQPQRQPARHLERTFAMKLDHYLTLGRSGLRVSPCRWAP